MFGADGNIGLRNVCFRYSYIGIFRINTITFCAFGSSRYTTGKTNIILFGINSCTACCVNSSSLSRGDASDSSYTKSPDAGSTAGGRRCTAIDNNVSALIQYSGRGSCCSSYIRVDGNVALQCSYTCVGRYSIHIRVNANAVFCTDSYIRSNYMHWSTDCNRRNVDSITFGIVKSKAVPSAYGQCVITADTLKCFVGIHEQICIAHQFNCRIVSNCTRINQARYFNRSGRWGFPDAGFVLIRNSVRNVCS